MTRITLSKAAVDKILEDRDVRLRWDGAGSRGVPVLWYYRRSFATSHEGIVTEHGDGFSLSTIEAADVDAAKGVAFASVVVIAGFDILVAASESMLSSDFAIDWTKQKFTYEPDVSLGAT